MKKILFSYLYILIITVVSYSEVMMQGFYWDCPINWYTQISKKIDTLQNMHNGYGINRIWLPPPQKSDYGINSMGYDPYDYYDLGNFNQKDTYGTRFGTKKDLEKLIKNCDEANIMCIADIVLNHRAGGQKEFNENKKIVTKTDFSSVKSKMCRWRFNEFHPSTFQERDSNFFKDYPDICHVTEFKEGSAGFDLIQWGKWLKDEIGYVGGWRFDFAKGIDASYIDRFCKETDSTFGIIEYWDSIDLIHSYMNQIDNIHAFDFPLYYSLVDVFNDNESISKLINPKYSYVARNSKQAVTFVANHDTDKDAFVPSINRYPLLAYAFILTYEGYPCIFWKDYFNNGLANLGGKKGNGINYLVSAREMLADGSPEIKTCLISDEILAYEAKGNSIDAPGYLVIINNGDRSKLIKMEILNPYLYSNNLNAYAWYSYKTSKKPSDIFCNAEGAVSINVPPKSYVVYSLETEQ